MHLSCAHRCALNMPVHVTGVLETHSEWLIIEISVMLLNSSIIENT